MLPLFLIFLQVCSYLQETIPKTEAPPARATYLAAVYDETTNEIITIGGDYYQSSSRSPKITAFSLTTQKFRKIICYSDVEPKALSGHALYLSKDRKIYEFGYSSEIYSFNLESFSWKIEELKGDPLEERKYFGYTSFSFNSTDYVAIFGGLQDLGYNNDLFLIDFNSFYCKKIKPSKDFPSPSLGITLVYFNGSLYLFGYSPLKEPPHSKLFRFDLTSYSWEVLETTGQVPDPRVMHYAVVYNDEMYVIYGVLYETISEYDSIYKYNFYLKTWVLLSNESGTRVNIAAGV